LRTPREQYIDHEGVRRGWYVYLHRDNATNQVFYVGMGTGKRAWDTAKRSDLWRDRVCGLKDGFTVEIVEDDLTENEAGRLEYVTVEKYGSVGEGSALTNQMLGGNTLAIGIGGNLIPEGLFELAVSFPYEKIETTKSPREATLIYLAEFEEAHKPLVERKAEFVDDRGLANHDVTYVDDVVDSIECAMDSIESAIEDYRTRNISWAEYCQFFSELYQDFRNSFIDLEEEEFEHDDSVKRLISYTKEVLSLYSGFLERITK